MPRVAKKTNTKKETSAKVNPSGAVTVTLGNKAAWFRKQAKRFGMTNKSLVLAAVENYVETHEPLKA